MTLLVPYYYMVLKYKSAAKENRKQREKPLKKIPHFYILSLLTHHRIQGWGIQGLKESSYGAKNSPQISLVSQHLAI